MDKIICYTRYLPINEEQVLSFMDILLDDNWADGEIMCPDSIYSEVGDFNSRLSEKRNYEFLLRAVKKFPVLAIGTDIEPSQVISSWEAFRTDCYVTSKYQSELREAGLFESVLETLIVSSKQLDDPERALTLLKNMILQTPEYFKIDDDTQSILIYRGDSTCYNVLNSFVEQLSQALSYCHQKIEIFDHTQADPTKIFKYTGKHLKAIIGVQDLFFKSTVNDTNLHDLITAPKFNIILDHPLSVDSLFFSCPKDYHLLLHDRTYINFAKKYYKNISGCHHFCPAGILPPPTHNLHKTYDISFIGSYYDYRTYLQDILRLDRQLRFMLARFLRLLKQNPYISEETALKIIVDYYDIKLNNDEFYDWLHNTFFLHKCINQYYREKIIRSILNAGITLHVYGKSWKHSPFASHSGLIIHPQCTVKESLDIMQHSKISLNIMTMHRDGFTERIANAMLCRSVVLSDKSITLEEEFVNGEELVLFDLNCLEELPHLINDLLHDGNNLERIAQKGFEKAQKNHQWINRAKQLLDIIHSL